MFHTTLEGQLLCGTLSLTHFRRRGRKREENRKQEKRNDKRQQRKRIKPVKKKNKKEVDPRRWIHFCRRVFRDLSFLGFHCNLLGRQRKQEGGTSQLVTEVAL